MENRFIEQELKKPVSLFSLLPSMPKKKAKGMGERQNLVNRVCYELNIQDSYRSGIFWQTKIMTDDEIKSLRDQALSWKVNSGALFRKLVRQKREEIMNKLKKEV